MKKKKQTQQISEASIPAGVYPELDKDLGRNPMPEVFPSTLGGVWPGSIGNPFPLGVYPVFDDDLPRDNTENNITADNLEGVWPDPRLK